MTLILIKFLFLSFLSQGSTAVSPFLKGISELKQKNYAAAEISFQEDLKDHPNNPESLYNLGLISFEKKKIGWAAGFWRKALYHRPNFVEAQKSLAWAENEELIPSSQKNLQSYLLQKIIIFFSFNELLIVCSILLSLSFYLWMKKIRSLNQKAPPLKVISLLVIMVLGVSIIFIKLADRLTPRATVVRSIALLKINPDSESITIHKVSEGEEVWLLKIKKNWIQIKTQQKKIGWIKQTEIMQSHGEQL